MIPCASRRFATLLVLLALQAAAVTLGARRDPGDRFRAAATSGLVWMAVRRLPAPPGR